MSWPVPRQSRHGSLKPNAPWLRLTKPVPPQVGQRAARRARLGAAAVAGAAGARAGQLQRQRRAAHRLVEVERDLGVDVLAARSGRSSGRRRAAARAAAEQAAEQVAETAADVAAAAAEQVGHVERRSPGDAADPPTAAREAARKPPPANSARASSYSLRLAGSDSTS